jgi:hypothetical protein
VNDADIYPILLKQGSNSYTVENVSITGSTGRRVGIRVESGREGTVVRNCDIDLDSGTGIAVGPLREFAFAGLDIDVPDDDITIDNSKQLTGLPYTITLEGPGEEATTFVLTVSGDLRPHGSVGNVSLDVSDFGAQATGQINGSLMRFGFSGDIRRLSIDPSVVASINTMQPTEDGGRSTDSG